MKFTMHQFKTRVIQFLIEKTRWKRLQFYDTITQRRNFMEEIVKSYRLNQDGSRTAVGTYVRNSKWPEGTDDLYIVGINNWIINSNGEFLVQQRGIY